MRDDVSQRALITADVARKLSEMAAHAEFIVFFRHHQPKIFAPRDIKASNEKTNRRISIAGNIQDTLAKVEFSDLTGSFSHFEYPLGKMDQQTGEKKISGSSDRRHLAARGRLFCERLR